jgi:hypothetical protein
MLDSHGDDASAAIATITDNHNLFLLRGAKVYSAWAYLQYWLTLLRLKLVGEDLYWSTMLRHHQKTWDDLGPRSAYLLVEALAGGAASTLGTAPTDPFVCQMIGRLLERDGVAIPTTDVSLEQWSEHRIRLLYFCQRLEEASQEISAFKKNAKWDDTPLTKTATAISLLLR